jgi:hypothetical protein
MRSQRRCGGNSDRRWSSCLVECRLSLHVPHSCASDLHRDGSHVGMTHRQTRACRIASVSRLQQAARQKLRNDDGSAAHRDIASAPGRLIIGFGSLTSGVAARHPGAWQSCPSLKCVQKPEHSLRWRRACIPQRCSLKGSCLPE